MNSNHELVKAFQIAMNQPVEEKPVMLNRGSEVDQLALRMAANQLEHLTNVMRKNSYGVRTMFRVSLISEELSELLRAKTLVDQVDALADIMYLVIGTAVEMGVDLQPCFEIVNSFNMDKLDPVTKKPIIDAQGKVRKRDGWEGPESVLAAEIERQGL